MITGQAMDPRAMKHLLRLFAVWIQSPGLLWQPFCVCRWPFHTGQFSGPNGREAQRVGCVKHEMTGGWYVAACCA